MPNGSNNNPNLFAALNGNSIGTDWASPNQAANNKTIPPGRT
ncbi:unnamed protein product, partial [marine sediment metagenome]